MFFLYKLCYSSNEHFPQCLILLMDFRLYNFFHCTIMLSVFSFLCDNVCGFNLIVQNNGLNGKFSDLSTRISYPPGALSTFRLVDDANTNTVVVETIRNLEEPLNSNRVNVWDVRMQLCLTFISIKFIMLVSLINNFY